jgi:K+-sensing histidine kinase KdpD
MTIGGAPANSSPEDSPAAPAVPSSAPPSWPRRRAGRWPRHLTRDRAAIAAALIAPLAAAAMLLPFRSTWSNTNTALLLVVVIVAVAAIGNRIAGAIAAICPAVWFDFFLTLPYYRFTIRHASDVTTFVLLPVVSVAVSQLAARARRLKVLAITDSRRSADRGR